MLTKAVIFGLSNNPSQYFCLSGFVVHELHWHKTLEKIINFRKGIKSKYALKLREELHAARFIHKPKEFKSKNMSHVVENVGKIILKLRGQSLMSPTTRSSLIQTRI